MKSMSPRTSLTSIPELPFLEDHYDTFSAMNISPAASPRKDHECRAKKRETRRSIIRQSLLSALRTLENDTDACCSAEFLDSSLTSITTSSTAPITDDESSSTNDEGVPIPIRSRWGSRNNDPKPVGMEFEQPIKRQSYPSDKHVLYHVKSRKTNLDNPPKPPVRIRSIHRENPGNRDKESPKLPARKRSIRR